MKPIQLLFAALLAFSFQMQAQSRYQYSAPTDRGDGWTTDHLQKMGIDTTGIESLFEQMAEGEHEIHSILLVKDGSLVLEEYFADQTTTTTHDLRSATKSIRSLLVGIALDKGIIQAIDDPISKYLEDPIPQKNLDPRKETITLRHLLTMSTGLDCNDWDKKSEGQEDRVYKKSDWLQYTLDLPMKHDPGTVPSYCSMGTVMLAEIVSQASGMPIDQFANQYLFEPLGISNVQWGHTSKKEVLPAAKRLYMTPRDMAKIGQLILNKGTWNGTRIISEAWIEQSTTKQVTLAESDYGFLWWNFPLGSEQRNFLSINAMGNGGQLIIVIPELEMVAVFSGGAYNSEKDRIPYMIVNNVFLPALGHED
ncbi:MAG: serine hydrolase [Bacteroidota bacterium]